LTSGILRTRAGRKLAPAEMLRLVNKSLRQRVIEGKFMTLCYTVYNARNRGLRFANSGSPPPILCKGGTAEILPVEGFPLGMFDNSEYLEREIVFEPGDVLVFYTDGLSEARDFQGEEFGGERLKAILEKNYNVEPRKLIDRIFNQIEKFCMDNKKLDDQTIVVLKAIK
jgi:phosphoserine phosphatase RsbU/P